MSFSNFLYRTTHWEAWHTLAKYLPIGPAWLWYCLRSRSFWFFTPSNPTLTFGGFEGESKSEMYSQLPPGTFPKSIYLNPGVSLQEAQDLIAAAGFTFPFAVKPDVGMSGYMFRVMENPADFQRYHAAMPINYIVQELIDYPVEVSAFYYRYPGQDKGRMTGFLKKEYLQVKGDGKSSLSELIMNYPRARVRAKALFSKHKDNLGEIVPAGEFFRLSSSLNFNQGCTMVNMPEEKTEKLMKVFDDLSNYSKHFYYGRYDIKCRSISDLQEGRNFSILEYNGSGAEPHEIYGGFNIFQAYGIILKHWQVLFEISRFNRKNGIRQWGFLRGYRFLKDAKKHFKMLKELDTSFKI